ncbi:MAG: DEAD/DEAH box helicase family protein [Oscillospiraceae bacterium]|jgi:superfamily II DNA or RNA helicase|nr:DEAD/DEAH box helicase family protein [Oscillospiraceae bacterium]
MDENTVLSKNAKTVKVKQGKNPRPLYPHQVAAIAELNTINKQDLFNTLVVLPTGAGKTMTATRWLLPTAIDNKKKVLWVAHRHLLLEQAADSFAVNAFSDIVLNRASFKYRIVSGQHDRPIHIKHDDDILVVSKDSIIRNMDRLDEWLTGENELYFVIDEAHHATARSYRRIIEHIKSKIPNVKMLGLTATPFRTSEQEQGLLGKEPLFTDDIVYKVDLDTLIKRGILSTPDFESYDTDILLGDELGLSAIKNIERLDLIPEDIAEHIAKNKTRNSFIVKTYFENDNHKKYGQTLVFALSRLHAITLKNYLRITVKSTV